MLIGGVVLYLFGGLWLATLIGPEGAFYQGVLPFLIGDILKALLAAIAFFGLQRVMVLRD